jgi:hypothetical protein
MEHRQDDFERRFLREAGVRVDRNAAAVVAHRDPAMGAELQLDPAGKASDRLVHRIVERLGSEMMQGPLVGAADIHAGPPAHRFEPLEDLDVLGGIAVPRGAVRPRWSEAVEKIRHGPDYREACTRFKQDAVYSLT